MNLRNISIAEGNTIEVHFYFNDYSHSMDAIVLNRCESDLLTLIDRIATIVELKIVIETEPFAEGGIRRWFKIVAKEESKKATIKIALITALSTAIFITPITSSVGKVIEIAIEKVFEDEELNKLEKQKLRLEIDLLKQEIQNKKLHILKNISNVRMSSFYEALDKYPKVEKVSFIIEDKFKNQISAEKTVLRNDFNDFIKLRRRRFGEK